MESPERQTGPGFWSPGQGSGQENEPGLCEHSRSPWSGGACPGEQMEGEGARPGEQAHLRGGRREQAHDGGLGGPAQGVEAVTEGAAETRQHGCQQTVFWVVPVRAERL